MWIQGLRVVFLAPTSYDSWRAAKGLSDNPITSEAWLTGFAVVCLTISLILFLWVYAKRKRTETNLRDNITDLTITTFKLRQEKDQLRQEKDQLAATNKELQRAIAELSRKQAAVLDTMKR